jgi:PEP-CTERM motif
MLRRIPDPVIRPSFDRRITDFNTSAQETNMKVGYITAALALGIFVPSVLHAQCPTNIGDATLGCDLVITVTNSGFTVANGPSSGLGGGTYDGSDDTLIGIINNSSSPLSSINLASSTDIYGFDGDGIDTFGAPSNTSDTSGYGGPDTFYTNINSTDTSGTVDFVTALAANGGSTYFSFEEALVPSQIVSPVPEPGTLLMMGTGIAGFAGMLRRKFAK